jgi:hypothetical protein
MYEEQMKIIRENNKIKYENKMMRDCDEQSFKVQELFRQEGIKRKEQQQQQRQHQRQQQRQQQQSDILEIILQEEMNSYLNYVFNLSSMPNNTKTFEEIYDGSIELYHERCLKRQQDLEYDNSIFEDMNK